MYLPCSLHQAPHSRLKKGWGYHAEASKSLKACWSTLEHNSIHIDHTLWSSMYETESIHHHHMGTTCVWTQLIVYICNCDCAQLPLFVHVIGRIFVNKSTRFADTCTCTAHVCWFGCFLFVMSLWNKTGNIVWWENTWSKGQRVEDMEVASRSKKVMTYS